MQDVTGLKHVHLHRNEYNAICTPGDNTSARNQLYQLRSCVICNSACTQYRDG